MLVLTRKSNQSIMIGDDIEVSVLRSWARRSGSGSRPPGTSPVFRKEVYLEIQEERGPATWPGRPSATRSSQALRKLARALDGCPSPGGRPVVIAV